MSAAVEAEMARRLDAFAMLGVQLVAAAGQMITGRCRAAPIKRL